MNNSENTTQQRPQTDIQSGVTYFPRKNLDFGRWKLFLEFLCERQRIFHKKEILKQPFPWTEDKVLQKAKIINLYREADAGTRFELNNIIFPNQGSLISQVYGICLYRHTNSITTYSLLKNGGSFKDLENLFAEEGTRRSSLVSDAIMFICPKGSNRVKFIWDYKQILDQNIEKIFKGIGLAGTGADVGKILQKNLLRIGSFYSYEMYTSLTYCRDFKFTEDDWLVVGPGAYPGLQLVFNCELDWKITEQLIRDTKDRIAEELDKMGFIWLPRDWQPKNPVDHKWTLRNVEHSLCEYRKWTNISQGWKKIRRSYSPTRVT